MQKSCLIVDDDPTSRKVLEHAIGQVCSIISCADGLSACQLIEQRYKSGDCFDLVVLDIGMPAVDGIDVLCSLREIEKSQTSPIDDAAKVIFVTSSTEEENIYDAHALSCDAYLVKPINIEELRREMVRLGVD